VCVTAARLLDSVHKIRFICTSSIKEELKFLTEARYLFISIALRDRSENISPWSRQRMLTNPYLLVLSCRELWNRLIRSQENTLFIISMTGFLRICSWKICSKPSSEIKCTWNYVHKKLWKCVIYVPTCTPTHTFYWRLFRLCMI
jgi:hypothetical protein